MSKLTLLLVLLLLSTTFHTCLSSSGVTYLDLTGDNVWTLTNDVTLPLPSSTSELRVLQGSGNVTTTKTSVPGQVHVDLLRAGVLADPYVGARDVEYLWVGLDVWAYRRTFAWSNSALMHGADDGLVQLVCEGLDTAATVELNGHVIATTNNMFRRYTFDITALVQAGSNTLQITFESPITYAQRQEDAYPYVVPGSPEPVAYQKATNGTVPRAFIRKEQCSFGWDWGPAFFAMGIWQDIYIVSYAATRMVDVVSRTYPVGEDVTDFTMHVDAYVDALADTSGVLTARVVDGAQVVKVTNETKVSLKAGSNKLSLFLAVQAPKLWWPNGYGAPNLYTLEVVFTDAQAGTTQAKNQTIGFRSVELIETPLTDEPGRLFYFKVNGVPVFVKGANFIPIDAFHARVNQSRMEELFESALAVNMNAIRNWGGGIYQTDAFYELANRHGLLVWEEFMFACAMYPRDEAFLSNVREEVQYQVRRLSHHPSIFLWSGNNENEGAIYWYEPSRTNPILYAIDYMELNANTVQATILTEDDSRPFWTSSPSNGILSHDPFVQEWGNVQNETMGDVHFYDYGMNCYNVSGFPRARFASEYGFQSLPSIYSLDDVFTHEADYNFNSSAINHREHHPNGTWQLLEEVQMHFRYSPPPLNVTTREEMRRWIYMTQAMQAMCIRTETEYYRSLRSEKGAYTHGALYWQLNSIWPAPTWSSLEYSGRWKMLHYYAQHFFAPVMVTAYERPTGTLNVYVANDGAEDMVGSASINVYTWAKAKLIHRLVFAYKVPARSSAKIYTDTVESLLHGGVRTFRNSSVFHVVLNDNHSNKLSESVWFPAPLWNSTLQAATVKATVGGSGIVSKATVSVETDKLTPFVFLETSLAGRFSDNGVLLFPGQPMELTFTGKVPFDVAALRSSLVVNTMPAGKLA